MEEHKPTVGSKIIIILRRLLWEAVTAIVPAVLIAMFINVQVARAIEIEAGPSMQPNLYQGNRLLIEKISYRLHLPERGDIVVVDRPGNEVSLVKRVLGLPGETVEVRGGHVLIDGQAIAEPWVAYFGGPDYGPARVPDGYIFIIGDNRANSHDSRAIGPVAVKDVDGKVCLVYWPLSEFRLAP